MARTSKLWLRAANRPLHLKGVQMTFAADTVLRGASLTHRPSAKRLARALFLTIAMLAGSHLVAGSAAAPCTVSADDRAWIDRSIAAWHFTAQRLTQLPPVDRLKAVFFDEHCTLTSDNALTHPQTRATFSAAPHGPMVRLPDGGQIPPSVTSFTTSKDGRPFFVMALPSIWWAKGVAPGPFGLEALMTAVLLHEASHVAQAGSYGAQVEQLSKRENLPDSFNDDSIQDRFQGDPEFSDMVSSEIELLFTAAAAPSEAEARAYAKQARDLMQKRRARWFTGRDAYLSEAEDIWLSMEGSGQWAGYRYLIDPAGGAVSVADATSGFARRGKNWTQHQGLALALTLDRLGVDWRAEAFGRGKQSLTDMLDEKLAKNP